MFKKSDDGIIDLRTKGKKAHDEDEPEFVINHVEEEEEAPVIRRPGHEDIVPALHERPEPPKPVVHEEPRTVEKVKIRFEKFLTLIVKADNDIFFQQHADQEIMLDANFLTDLASAGEGKKDRKWFLILVVGVIIGVTVAYFLFKK